MPKPLANETRVRQHEHRHAHFAAYHDEMHAETNQAKRLVKHLKHHPEDEAALLALMALPRAALARVPGALERVDGKAA